MTRRPFGEPPPVTLDALLAAAVSVPATFVPATIHPRHEACPQQPGKQCPNWNPADNHRCNTCQDRPPDVARHDIEVAVIDLYNRTAMREGRRARLYVLVGHRLWAHLRKTAGDSPRFPTPVWTWRELTMYVYDSPVHPVDAPLADLDGWRILRDPEATPTRSAPS